MVRKRCHRHWCWPLGIEGLGGPRPGSFSMRLCSRPCRGLPCPRASFLLHCGPAPCVLQLKSSPPPDLQAPTCLADQATSGTASCRLVQLAALLLRSSWEASRPTELLLWTHLVPGPLTLGSLLSLHIVRPRKRPVS